MAKTANRWLSWLSVGLSRGSREVVSSTPARPSLRVLNNRVEIVAFVITTTNG